MSRQEVDRLGRDELGGDGEVTLVLAVLVIEDQHELARSVLLDRLLDGDKRGHILSCVVPCEIAGPGRAYRRVRPFCRLRNGFLSVRNAAITSIPTAELVDGLPEMLGIEVRPQDGGRPV